jgi:unsaturated rhamnogalacturonyl hydrolase
MGQPFLAEYADHAGDSAQLDKVAARLDWVHDNMRSSTTGLFYHGANSSTDHVNFHWLRAIGWYAMAQVNVMPHMSGGNLTTLEGDFKDFVDGMLPYQDAATGMWKNLVDQAYSASGSNINRYETSGTAMMSYAILRAVRNGWLEDVDGTYTDAAIKAFEGIVNNKLVGGELIDTYFKGSASGSDNYHTASYYYADEGKGVGPFIMAYAEALQVEAPTGTIGGVNGDGTVDSTDALIVLSADAGIDTSQFCPMNCGDVNADGLVNSTDALILLSYDVGMTVPFPVGQPGCPPSVTQPAGCTP